MLRVSIFANNDMVLQDSYFFNDMNIIYSTDIFENISNKFKLFKIPSSVNFYKVPIHKINQIFKKNGFLVDSSNIKGHITFRRKMIFDEEYVKKYIKEQYKKAYKDISIEKIQIYAFSYIDIQNYMIEDMVLSKSMISNNQGSIKVFFVDKSKNNLSSKLNKKSIFFKYRIDASVPLYKASKNIRKDQKLTRNNISISKGSIPEYKKSIKSISFDSFYAKHNISKNAIIRSMDVKTKPLITRGSNVIVVYNIGSVKAQRSAKALENGYLGDWIRVKMTNNTGKKAKIIGKNRVQIN